MCLIFFNFGFDFSNHLGLFLVCFLGCAVTRFFFIIGDVVPKQAKEEGGR